MQLIALVIGVVLYGAFVAQAAGRNAEQSPNQTPGRNLYDPDVTSKAVSPG